MGPHCSRQTSAKLKRLKFECITHPFLQPGSDCLGYFTSDEEVKDFIEHWIRNQSPDFHANAIQKWIERMRKCIMVNGDYVKK